MRPAAFLLLLAAGCAADPDRFLPANSRGSAEYYELEREGRNWGDVKVWSTSPAGAEDLFEVRFRVRNDGDAPISADLGATYAELNLDGRLERVRARDVGGPLSVSAGESREWRIFFPLPSGFSVEDVDEAEVNWALTTSQGRLTHSTVFLPYYEEDGSLAYHYGYGYYRPWGWGWYDPYYR